MPGFFRIAKSVFSKIANSFGDGNRIRLQTTRLTQAKQGFPSNLGCIKLQTCIAVPPSRDAAKPTQQAGTWRIRKNGPKA
jgi:hypothetical protein